MRMLVWIVEDTWEATVDEAVALVPPDARITPSRFMVDHAACRFRQVWPDEAPSPAPEH